MGAGSKVEDRTGEVLGDRYRLVRRIGMGGMGSVYEAIQSDLGRRVALKILHPHLSLEPTLLERFRREALAAAALGHPNIVSVSEMQSPADHPPFLVMELLTGASLKQAIAAGPMDPARVANIGAQVLSALGAAHAERIVHRDVKPDNIILIDTNAMRDFVKVLDFGVAKLQRENVEGLTLAGAIVGTLSYMAPEQARGHDLDGRADIYSVGACMYHALSGRKPFDKRAKAELFAAVLMEPPAPLGDLCPNVDRGLVNIVERAMQKKPADRYGSADELVEVLIAWQKQRGGQASLPAAGAGKSPSLVPEVPRIVITPPNTDPGPPSVRTQTEVSVSGPTMPPPTAVRAAQQAAESSVAGPAALVPASSSVSSTKRTKSGGRLGIPWIVALGVIAGLLIERVYALLIARH